MAENRVSIIIPTYNRAPLLGASLDSIRAQSYRDWECIVVDDGSDDYTHELMEFYTRRDERINFTHRPDNRPKGANACRNYGFEKSSGSFIQWLDSDDILSPDKLEAQVSILKEQNQPLVFSKWGRFAGHSEPEVFEELEVYQNFEATGQFLNALADSIGYLPNHSYLIRRDLVKKAGPWNEYLKINQDGEYMSRVICNAPKILYSSEGYALYRWKEAGNTSETRKETLDDLINSWKLIDGYLKIRYKDETLYFIEKTKDRLFANCRPFPEILKHNRDFFRWQLRREPYSFTSWLHGYLVKYRLGRQVMRPLKIIRNKILEK